MAKANDPTNPKPEKPTKPKRAPEPEFQALARIDRILSDQKLPAALRIISLIHGRYQEKAEEAKNPPPAA